MDMFKDQSGKMSGKRIAGAVIAGIGLGLLIFLGISAMFTEIKDPETAKDAFSSILYVGGGLLGISVFEFFGTNKGGEDGRGRRQIS